MIYCLSCRKRTPDINLKPKVTRNNKPYVQANCPNCKNLKISICFYIKNKRRWCTKSII